MKTVRLDDEAFTYIRSLVRSDLNRTRKLLGRMRPKRGQTIAAFEAVRDKKQDKVFFLEDVEAQLR